MITHEDVSKSPKIELLYKGIDKIEDFLRIVTFRIIQEKTKNLKEEHQLFYAIGYHYVQRQKFLELHTQLNLIRKAAFNGIVDIEDLEDELVINTEIEGGLYEYILGSFLPQISPINVVDLDRDAIDYLSRLPDTAREELERQRNSFDQYIETVGLTAQLLTWEEDMLRVKEIAETKGDLMEVLRLT